MPHFCSAYGCSQKWIKGEGITFHSFPTNDARRKAWEIQLRRENFKASKYSKLCSKHFTDDCFDKNRFGGTWLKPDALPTIFNFPPHLQKLVNEQNSVQRQSNENKDVDDKDVPGPSGILYEKRRRLHYVGDFSYEDVTSPENAKRFLQIAQEQKSSFNKKMKQLHKKNDGLKRRISSLEKKLDEWRQKSFTTHTASSVLGALNIVGKEVKDRSPQEEQDNIPVEPSIRIKEEPTDDYSTPSTSNSTTSEEFILPHVDIPWTTTSPLVEPQLTLSVASLNSPNVPEPSDCEPLEKKLRTDSSNITIASVSTLASLSTVPSNYTAVKPQSPAPNFENISTPGSSKEHQKYQFDSFAQYVATKLDSLDPISSSCAQKDIKNIILQAEMGKYLNQTQDIKPSIGPHSF